MWKKILVALIAFIGIGSVGYAYYNAEMSAANTTYASGGALTGRINMAPSGVNSTQIGLTKGDKILLGNGFAMQLIYRDSGYTDYISGDVHQENSMVEGLSTDEYVSVTTSPQAGAPLTAWYSLATKSIDQVTAHNGQLYRVNFKHEGIRYLPYGETNIAQAIANFNASFSGRGRDLIASHDLSVLRSTVIDEVFGGAYMNDKLRLKYDGEIGEKFIAPLQVNGTKWASKISNSDLTFSSEYWSSRGMNDGDNYVYSNTDPLYNSWVSILADGTRSRAMNGATEVKSVRPAAFIDTKNIVFALSQGTTQGTLAQIEEKKLVPYASLWEATSSWKEMKARLLNTSMRADLKEIMNNKKASITKVAKDGKVTLKVDANAGTGPDGSPYTISVLVFKNNAFMYYKPLLMTQSGTQEYTFDTTGIPLGKYQIAVVNEAYNDGSDEPSDSSKISGVKNLEIVPPHEIQYAKTPGAGATKGDYEYSKNVNAGDTVGKITLNPIGVTPITYEIITNGDNTYQNLEIDGLDSSNASGATTLNVKIKNGAPDLDNGGLKVGNYKFCITSTDANGYPDTQIEGKTKVCTSFTVDKTKLTIEFDDKEDTKKTVEEAATPWNETATGKPTHGTKITYSIVGGDIGLIDLDEGSGQVTYKGNGQFGKVKIRATIDDDPDTGNDNYESAYTEKEVIIAQEVDGIVTPDSASSDTTIPTFKASDANVKIGGTIGTIKGTKGTPDTIGGSTTTYSYKIKSGGNGSFFQVNSSTGVIKSNANLAVGTYKFTITVSDKWTSKDVEVTVNVGVAPAEALKFYESSSSNTVIDKKEVNYTDKNVSVFATVKGSSNNNPVTYKIKDGSTNVITINPNSGAVTIKGVGTVTIVAEKKGASGQADATAELTFTVKPVEQKFIYTTDSTLSTERPKTGDYYSALVETYAPNKTFNVYTKGNPTGSTVTYRLKEGSPEDVISVDPDGTIHILNASLNNQIGKVIVEAISHDPSGNYEDKTIELPINIEKGTRKIAFAENPINVVSGTGSVTPNILVDGVLDTSGTAVIEVDPKEENSIAWTNDGETIQYEWEKKEPKNIKLHVTKPSDRNYKAAEGDGILHILGADENVLTLSTPGKIIYGDHFTIRSTQDDSGSTNVQYKFETDNGVYISAPQVNGNRAEFDALAYSGSTTINIKVTRTADGELPLTKTVSIKVLPKPITITIDDKEKKRLEENPPLTYKDFSSQLVSWDGVKDDIDTSHIKLTTTAKKTSPVGTYPITAGSTQKQLNDNYPNYTFTIKEGKLNIKDNGNKDFWDDDDDGCPDFNITITGDDGNTILINGDKNDDGIPDYNIDSNGDGKPDLNLDTDNDGKPDLNLVMLKSWKPSRCVTVNGVNYESGISAKAEINVDVDGDGIPDINIDNKGDFKPHINISKDGKKPQVNIAIIHTWKPDKDCKKGNFSFDTMVIDEKKEVLINIDTDGDGLPDINIDLDDDGEPDINKDVDGDWIPDIDIDSTGDGIPDVNVDTNGDGEPDENIIEITEWKPEHNAKEPFPYDTMSFNDPKKPDDPINQEPDTDVNGAYYPGANVGGAMTGDTSNIMMYLGLGCGALGMLCFLCYKRNEQS